MSVGWFDWMDLCRPGDGQTDRDRDRNRNRNRKRNRERALVERGFVAVSLLFER